MPNKHRKNYHKDYRNKIINTAIIRYGGKCSCAHCVIDNGLLLIVATEKQDMSQGQYGLALYLKRKKYKKGLAKVFCFGCYPTCRHDYKGYRVYL